MLSLKKLDRLFAKYNINPAEDQFLAMLRETARLKMTESAYLLLNSDRSYAAALFDFTSTCKMNMLDLLVEHDSTDFRWKLYFIRKNS